MMCPKCVHARFLAYLIWKIKRASEFSPQRPHRIWKATCKSFIESRCHSLALSPRNQEQSQQPGQLG